MCIYYWYYYYYKSCYCNSYLNRILFVILILYFLIVFLWLLQILSPKISTTPSLLVLTRCTHSTITHSLMHSNKCNLYSATLSVSDLERAEICEKYNNPKTKELLKMSCYRSNSHVGSAVLYAIAVHKGFVTAPDLFVH